MSFIVATVLIAAWLSGNYRVNTMDMEERFRCHQRRRRRLIFAFSILICVGTLLGITISPVSQPGLFIVNWLVVVFFLFWVLILAFLDYVAIRRYYRMYEEKAAVEEAIIRYHLRKELTKEDAEAAISATEEKEGL